ncbi:hypothetical protein N7456_004164 [Penicillium angulare]|uniref:Uncharacterized protein n=1 Tax=Penicillium angulare TaxID=116970 RepID=A0A9W9KI45_9EURO|nr:hypothetical protein N7456_004164 [Penicillium angulare]
MSLSFLHFLIFNSLGIICSAQPLSARTGDSTFNIYAYGDGISGLQVYYSDVTVSSSDTHTWLAHPNPANSTWANMTLYMAESSSREVGFTSKDTAGKITNAWWLYGQYVMVTKTGVNFYAEKKPDLSGDYTLSWGDSSAAETEKTLVTLRTIAPSTDSVLS